MIESGKMYKRNTINSECGSPWIIVPGGGANQLPRLWASIHWKQLYSLIAGVHALCPPALVSVIAIEPPERLITPKAA